MVITDQDIIEQDGYTIHLPPKAEGQTHWQVDVLDTSEMPPEPKEWRIITDSDPPK